MFCVLALLAVINVFCSFIPQENPYVHAVIGDFIRAVEENQTKVTFTLLTKNAFSRIDRDQLAKANGDFQVIVEAFRQAEIMIRSKYELPFYVSNFGGQDGDILFIVVQENGKYKIANLINRKD